MRSLNLLIAAALFTSPLAAQIPDKFTNLQFFAKEIPRDSLIANMRAITGALGVRCNYCHTGGDGRSLQGVDFASDDKLTKAKARLMLEMTRQINGELLANVPDRRQPAVVVECETCHRGLAVPRTLATELVNVASAHGGDSAAAFYSRAREQHPDDGVYDFSERSISQAARVLLARGKTAEAVRLLEVNAEIFPQSPRTLAELGAAYEAAGNKEKAIAAYRRVLEIAPNEQQARRRLTALTVPPQ
ncbi:MAG: c-type cytochrome [Gemmatimonadaceae bacterium]